jgi:hypothetical protein
VTPNGTENLADIGLARGGRGVLNVIWASGLTSAGHAKIMDTPISSGGAVGRPATIVSGYYLITYPDVTVAGPRIDAIWNGIKGTSSSSPQGTFESTRPFSGGARSAPINVNAQASRLHVLALLTRHNKTAYWATQVR